MIYETLSLFCSFFVDERSVPREAKRPEGSRGDCEQGDEKTQKRNCSLNRKDFELESL